MQWVEQKEAVKQRKEEERRDAAQRREEEREEREEAELEQRLQQAEAERQQEEAEYSQWQSTFRVHTPPPPSSSPPSPPPLSSESLLPLLRGRKTTGIAELAVQLRVSASALTAAIEGLQAEGSISGVWDERGRWLRVDESEWEQLRHWLDTRGRVSVADLVEQVRKVVDVSDSSTDAQQLQLDDDDEEDDAHQANT